MTMPSFAALLELREGTHFTIGSCSTPDGARDLASSLVGAGLPVRVRGIVPHFEGTEEVVAALLAEHGR